MLYFLHKFSFFQTHKQFLNYLKFNCIFNPVLIETFFLGYKMFMNQWAGRSRWYIPDNKFISYRYFFSK